MTTIIEKIEKLRKNANMKQSELAKLLGVSRARYNYWKQMETSPDPEFIGKISEIFNVPLKSLISENGPDTIYISDLTEHQQECIIEIINEFRKFNKRYHN